YIDNSLVDRQISRVDERSSGEITTADSQHRAAVNHQRIGNIERLFESEPEVAAERPTCANRKSIRAGNAKRAAGPIEQGWVAAGIERTGVNRAAFEIHACARRIKNNKRLALGQNAGAAHRQHTLTAGIAIGID